ncbi:hypothetical protein BSKO_05849 [Bryopsis sp. KO-2023]|nr:hypothetical protein BSKO_05849 [Bryopsis sp. KO-2023]
MGAALGCIRGCEAEPPPVLSHPTCPPEDDRPASECRICCRDTSEVSIPQGQRVSTTCTHKRRVCEACVKKHIHEEVMIKSNVNITCIDADCGKSLEHADVKRRADRADFEQYDRILLKRTLEAMAEFRWCSRAGCGCGQLHADQERMPIIRCHACRAETCFTHRCPWHTDRTCSQYDEDARRVEEVALLQLLERSNFKRCPKCNHAIEKTGGCDHMTCRQNAGGCGAEFCWLCLADYGGLRGIRRKGSKAHAVTCRYYS